MMIAILGDIHANHAALKAAVDYCDGIGVKEYFAVGDIVGYYASPNECIQLIQDKGIESVMGNHDSYVLQNDSLDEIKLSAKSVIEWTRKNLDTEKQTFLRQLPYIRKIEASIPFRVVHASLCQPYMWDYIKAMSDAINVLTIQDTPVCFCGHTHTAVAYAIGQRVIGGTFDKIKIENGTKYLINVGSVGQPRDGGFEARVVLFDVEQKEIALKKIPYDPSPTIAAHKRSGLPTELLNYFE